MFSLNYPRLFTSLHKISTEFHKESYVFIVADSTIAVTFNWKAWIIKMLICDMQANTFFGLAIASITVQDNHFNGYLMA